MGKSMIIIGAGMGGLASGIYAQMNGSACLSTLILHAIGHHDILRKK